MAHGNLGVGLYTYGMSLYDPGHGVVFLHFALLCLDKSLVGQLQDDERTYFQATRDHVEHLLSDHYSFRIADLNAFPVGKSHAERLYRQWCLKERLFLNPLNDLGNYAVAAQDVLHCPPITKGFSDEMIPWERKLINQLKQEFVSARFMFYDALQSKSLHFADRDNVIINTLDYASNSLRTEKIKAGLRMAYSLLDKVARFLDEYLFRKSGEGKKGRIYFKSVWHEKQFGSSELKVAFRNRKNWPLRGLYSLRNDFFGHKNQMYMPTDIAFMNEIRNKIEHNFFVVLLSDFVGNTIPEQERQASREYAVTSDELETAALRMLKTARSSIIYLLLAIHAEEGKSEGANSGLVVPMTPVIFEDRGKR